MHVRSPRLLTTARLTNTQGKSWLHSATPWTPAQTPSRLSIFGVGPDDLFRTPPPYMPVVLGKLYSQRKREIAFLSHRNDYLPDIEPADSETSQVMICIGLLVCRVRALGLSQLTSGSKPRRSTPACHGLGVWQSQQLQRSVRRTEAQGDRRNEWKNSAAEWKMPRLYASWVYPTSNSSSDAILARNHLTALRPSFEEL